MPLDFAVVLPGGFPERGGVSYCEYAMTISVGHCSLSIALIEPSRSEL